MMNLEQEGQLSNQERAVLTDAVLNAPRKPEVLVEIGTWVGGGSTITFLKALQKVGAGHLWGVEADRSIYDQMTANLKQAVPDAFPRFTPLFGFSQDVLPKWIAGQPKPFQIDIAFLDGGNNPAEQITEFEILDPYLPVGSRLLAHDAQMRKGKWLVPYLSRLDNWDVQVLNSSVEGLLTARKLAAQPSPASRRAARSHLLLLRLNPIEIVATLLPSGVIRFLLRFIPRKLGRRLTDGRKE